MRKYPENSRPGAPLPSTVSNHLPTPKHAARAIAAQPEAVSRRRALIGLATGLTAASAAVIATAARSESEMAGGHHFASPEDRARRAWAEFSAAMVGITVGSSGWIVVAGGVRLPFHNLPGGSFRNLFAIRYEMFSDPRVKTPFPIERHERIEL